MKNREIKFRAWDKKFGYMYLPEKTEDYRGWFQDLVSWNKDGQSGASIDLSVAIYDEDLILMQYTGLTDKNGKEIYEGDIVKETVGDEIVVAEMTPKFFHHLVEYAIDIDWFYEVIGNIYENEAFAKMMKNPDEAYD